MGRILNINGSPAGLHITARGNIVLENTLENSIHEGRRFFLRNYQDVSLDDTVNFLMVPAEGYDVHLDAEFFSDVNCSIEAWFNITIGDYGTEQLLLNHNQKYALSQPYLKVYKDATFINDDGVMSLRSKIDSAKKASASRADTGEYVLSYPIKSLVKITAEADGYIGWNMGFSEVAAGAY